MNSSLPKPLHSVAGKPILSHIIENINAASINDIIVVINNESDDLKNYLNKNHPNVRTCVQENQNGTGDAVKSVFDNYDLSESDGVVVIFGDTPLLKLETIQKLSESSLKSDLTIMAFELPNLPYAHDALEPHIDAKTMEIHHGKHHNGYTTNLNNAIEGTDLAGESINLDAWRATDTIINADISAPLD